MTARPKNNNKKKVVVTGGAGFIGSHLVETLIKRGFDVHIIAKSLKRKKGVNKKAVFHQADICDLKKIKPIIAGSEFVFHLAGMPGEHISIAHPLETHRVNVDGTVNLLIASSEAKVKRFIHSSSSSVYGDQNSIPHTEDMIPHPKSPYGLQKYICELYCKLWSDLYKLPTVSLRYFSVYGPRLGLNEPNALVIDQFLKNKKEGKPFRIMGDGKPTRDFIHVYDVVRANILALKSKKVGCGEVINIGTGKNFSILALAKLIGGKIEYIPKGNGPHDTLADIRMAKKIINWEPKVKLEDGMKELKKLWGC